MLEPSRLNHNADSQAVLHSKRVGDSAPALDDLPDLLLVERTRGRELRAFETLMRRYNVRLYRITRSILSSNDAAEDAVRAAYARAFANLDRYEPAGKFGAWLARLAFNEALALRKHSAGQVTPFGEATATPATVPGEVPSRQDIERAIDALPEVFRTVLVLRLVEDLSGVEVAVCLGLNETTVRTRLYRAQQRLKSEVAGQLRASPQHIFELTPERGDAVISQAFARLHSGAAETK